MAGSGPRLPLAALALALALALGGCKPKIGDGCRSSIDCSITGTRICDLSYRVDGQGFPSSAGKGECIIDGCSHGTCPKEATCVRVYGSTFLTVACDPEREDVGSVCVDDVCPPECVDGRCPPPPNECEANEVCLPEGLCADEISARTSCRRECSDDGDCRAGYACRETGSDGVYLVPDAKKPGVSQVAKICMPAPI